MSVIDGVLWRVGKSSPVCIAAEVARKLASTRNPEAECLGDLLHVIYPVWFLLIFIYHVVGYSMGLSANCLLFGGSLLLRSSFSF